MLKLIGSILIVGGAGGIGISKALRFYRQLRQLKELVSALAVLSCELNYTLLPVAELCRLTASRVSGTAASFLQLYAQALEQGNTRQKSVQLAMGRVGYEEFPNGAQMAILELFGNLGRYDLEGENRLLQLTSKRLNEAAARYESEKRPLAKGYAVLGLCVGTALVILLV